MGARDYSFGKRPMRDTRGRRCGFAATYDPAELSILKVQGVAPDPLEARKWYERAHVNWGRWRLRGDWQDLAAGEGAMCPAKVECMLENVGEVVSLLRESAR